MAVLFGEDNGWVWRSWKEFIGDRFKKVPNVSKYHHFRFTADAPGVVFLKKKADDTDEVRFVICKTHLLQMSETDVPDVINPAGLSSQRKRYLYSQVRPLVRAEFRDVLCPKP